MHLTPKVFLNLVEMSIFYDFLNCGKCRQKRRRFCSSPRENLFLENGVSDVNSRTDFPAIAVKSTHFFQPADLLSLFITRVVCYALQRSVRRIILLNMIGFQGLSTAFQFLTTITFADVLKKEHTAVSTPPPINRE